VRGSECILLSTGRFGDTATAGGLDIEIAFEVMVFRLVCQLA
jgi:hypothetical protein